MKNDLISRREAVDRINKQREHLQPEIYPQDEIGDAAYRICAEFIERLPSAQPYSKELSSTHKALDTISRQAAIDAIKNADVCMAWNGEISAEDAADIAVRATKRSVVDSVEDLPLVQPEIIHCRDCRWRKDQSGSTAWLPCRAIVTPSDFYCGLAERRTDE